MIERVFNYLKGNLLIKVYVFIHMSKNSQAHEDDPSSEFVFSEGVLNFIVMDNHLSNVNSGFCIDLKIEFLGEGVNAKNLADRLDEFIQGR